MAGKEIVLCFRACLFVGFNSEDYLYTVFVVIAFVNSTVCNLNIILIPKDV